MDRYYVQVILPLKIGWIPVYSSKEPVRVGQCVTVEFSHRNYTGFVWKEDAAPEIESGRILEILSVVKDMPIITAAEIDFWKFIADYYLCTVGEVFKAAYPSLRLRSERTQVSELERLRTKLAKCEAAIAGKHRANVMQRLENERTELKARIAAMTACSHGQAASQSQAVLQGQQGQLSKPLLIQGRDRYPAYADAIREALKDGGQVLVLTPEIAFCKRLEGLLRPGFGELLEIVNSMVTPKRRQQVSDSLRRGRSALVLGTRSAVFLPFSKLSLVIIDEEQDPSYKQTDPAPRINGRDAAVALAHLHSARVILGSACPSFESLYNCSSGKYNLAPCDNGRNQSCDSGCVVIDISSEKRKNGMVGSFSRKLIDRAASVEGRLVFVRGWEKAEELRVEAETIFSGRDFDILSLSELKRQGAGDAALIGIVQADALVSKDDFRSDERAIQLIALMRGFAGNVVIQTAVAGRFDASRSVQDLMNERREFGFPPYSRLVEVKRQGSHEILSMHFLARDNSLKEAKARLVDSLQKDCYLDVDP